MDRIIYGLTEDTQRGHILRATLEAVCFQVRDILEAMSKDCKFHLVKLNVDGGMTSNEAFLQLQADLIGIEVRRPTMAESTALVGLLLLIYFMNRDVSRLQLSLYIYNLFFVDREQQLQPA